MEGIGGVSDEFFEEVGECEGEAGGDEECEEGGDEDVFLFEQVGENPAGGGYGVVLLVSTRHG